MIINPVFNGVEDYETVPPANISGMFNLANHQVNLTFKIYLNLLILHFPLSFSISKQQDI